MRWIIKNKKAHVQLLSAFPKNRKGAELLQKYVIFIVLNLIFMSVLLFFISSKINGVSVLEESYSKNIALLIDASTPIMEMKLNMGDAFDLVEKNKISRDEIVKIENNSVIVKLSATSGYTYNFFNDVDVTAYADIYPSKNYLIKINGYK
ncbi:MAG: hypothetical protein WC511_03535 [Candidatus Pacearchaeota archaeon]